MFLASAQGPTTKIQPCGYSATTILRNFNIVRKSDLGYIKKDRKLVLSIK